MGLLRDRDRLRARVGGGTYQTGAWRWGAREASLWGNPFSEDSIGNVTLDSFRRLTDYSHRESVAQNNVGSALGIIRLEFTDAQLTHKAGPDRYTPRTSFFSFSH